jgi:hypothetical protein
LAADVWQELYQLMRIERIEQRDPALLAPRTEFLFARESQAALAQCPLGAYCSAMAKPFAKNPSRAPALLLERYFDLRAPCRCHRARKTLATPWQATDVGFNLALD